MLSTIIGALSGSVVKGLADTLFGKVESIFKEYFQGQVTKEQLLVELQKALLTSFVEVEKAHAESLSKTYQSFMDAAARNNKLAIAWAVVLYSQVVVLLWSQLGIPALCFFMGNRSCWPSAGTTVDWAYALVAGLLGLGAVALRTGPGKFDFESLKNLVARK